MKLLDSAKYAGIWPPSAVDFPLFHEHGTCALIVINWVPVDQRRMRFLKWSLTFLSAAICLDFLEQRCVDNVL